MKPFATISLFLLVITYSFGYLAYYTYSKIKLRREMEVYLRHNPNAKECSDLYFSYVNNTVVDKEFSWEWFDEFVYRGEKYDIVFSDTANNTIRFRCIKDDAENALEKKIMDIHQHHGNTQKGEKLFKFLSLYYTCVLANATFQRPFTNYHYPVHLQRFGPYPDNCVITPPPELA